MPRLESLGSCPLLNRLNSLQNDFPASAGASHGEQSQRDKRRGCEGYSLASDLLAEQTLNFY